MAIPALLFHKELRLLTHIFVEDDYENCDSLITKSSSQWPQSSITELMAAGIAQEKLVIGKPATQKDASNGYIDPGTLAGCVSQAKEKGWSAGVMVWEVSGTLCILSLLILTHTFLRSF